MNEAAPREQQKPGLPATPKDRRSANNTLSTADWQWLNDLIVSCARTQRLHPQDIADAQQQVAYAVLQAIAQRGLRENEHLTTAQFRRFLFLTATRRLQDFARRVRRFNKRYHSSSDLFHHLAAESPDPLARRVIWMRVTTTDPQMIAAQEEKSALLKKQLEELSAEERLFWTRLCSGGPLRVIAAELNVAAVTVRRRKKRLVQKLKLQLHLTDS